MRASVKGMLLAESAETANLLQAAVTAVSLLGGLMAYASGYFAAQAMAERQSPDVLSQRVNEGIARGFLAGWPIASLALIIEMWS